MFINFGAKALGRDTLCSTTLPKIPPNLPKRRFLERLKQTKDSYHAAKINKIKWLVKFCINQYKLDMPRIAVKFSDLPEHKAAHIFSKNGICYIEVDKKFRRGDIYLTAIIAHEIAHILLAMRNIKLTFKIQNEELTDTVAILAGFGKALSHTYRPNPLKRKRLPYLKEQERIHHHVGYLLKDEVKWIRKIKDRIVNQKPIKRFSHIEVTKTPHLVCYACNQKLRIPQLNSTCKIKCPICQISQTVKIKTSEKGNTGIFLGTYYKSIQYILRSVDRRRGLL